MDNIQNNDNELIITTNNVIALFYNNVQEIFDPEGKPFNFSVDGSLGLLAMGHTGIIAWRKKKLEQMQKVKNKQ